MASKMHQMVVVEYKKEKKIPSEFPHIQEDVKSEIVIPAKQSSKFSENSESDDSHYGHSVQLDNNLSSIKSIGKQSVEEKTKGDRDRIMNLVKFAHEQAEETRVMLEKLNVHSKPENEADLKHGALKEAAEENQPIESNDDYIYHDETDEMCEQHTDTQENVSQSSHDTETRSRFDINLSSPGADARKSERARLIAEAKAKAAQEKKSVIEKLESDKKGRRSSEPHISDENSSGGGGGKGNASRYAAVLSISKDDARRAAVAKVRQESKKAAESKAKAEILSREAKLKALLAADREARAQKRIQDGSNGGTGSGSVSSPHTIHSLGNESLKDVVNGDLDLPPPPPNQNSSTTTALGDGGRSNGLPQSARIALSEGDLDSAYAQEDENASARLAGIKGSNDPELDFTNHSLATATNAGIGNGQCWAGDTNINSVKPKMGFWDSLFMCSNSADK